MRTFLPVSNGREKSNQKIKTKIKKLSRTGEKVNDFRAQVLVLKLSAGRLHGAAGGRDRTAVRRHDGKTLRVVCLQWQGEIECLGIPKWRDAYMVGIISSCNLVSGGQHYASQVG